MSSTVATGRLPLDVEVEAHQSPVIVPAQVPGAASAPLLVSSRVVHYGGGTASIPPYLIDIAIVGDSGGVPGSSRQVGARSRRTVEAHQSPVIEPPPAVQEPSDAASAPLLVSSRIVHYGGGASSSTPPYLIDVAIVGDSGSVVGSSRQAAVSRRS